MSELATIESNGALSVLARSLQLDSSKAAEVLRKTAFKECKNEEQFAALVVVANTYNLNPLTKELYAFPGKGGEVVPIVSIDGWLRIINDHPQMDGMDESWADDGSWCEVTIYRKDRSKPIVHREWLEEVKRNTDPWKQHPRRMLKWKTIIQAGRIAFGFGGIHDEDEGAIVAGRAPIRDVTPQKKEATDPFKDLNDSSNGEDPAPVQAGETTAAESPSRTKVEREAPKGRQKKERVKAEVRILSYVEPDESTANKPVWKFEVQGPNKKQWVLCYSSTTSNELMEQGESPVKLTMTHNVKMNSYVIESWEEVGEVDALDAELAR